MDYCIAICDDNAEDAEYVERMLVRWAQARRRRNFRKTRRR